MVRPSHVTSAEILPTEVIYALEGVECSGVGAGPETHLCNRTRAPSAPINQLL